MEDYRIICLEGELEEAEIIIHPGDCIVVGRESRFSNIVFQDMTISRKHCIIELDEQCKYWVTDFSECGLLTEDGIFFERYKRVQCQRKTILLIGKAGTKLMLG